MGLTSSSTGRGANSDSKTLCGEKNIALAGNPNVGKSTVFNSLTGLRQHTGNWTGKTVSASCGVYKGKLGNITIADLPGVYSLQALSPEEEIARDFIWSGKSDAVIVVCDATCLERNLSLVLQILEITPKVVVCLNLMDEAKKKNIHIDTKGLSNILGVPVVGTSARSGKGLEELMNQAEKAFEENSSPCFTVRYPEPIERAVSLLEMHIANIIEGRVSERWAALRLLECDIEAVSLINELCGFVLREHRDIVPVLKRAEDIITEAGYTPEDLRSAAMAAIYSAAQKICEKTVKAGQEYSSKQLRIDNFLTRRATGIPVMLLLLALIFYITIRGANYPSQLLSAFFTWLEPHFTGLLMSLNCPDVILDCLVDGIYRVLTWVISVMLPPMAIFFPLFTILEDLGYLPRVAFNLDSCFKKCHACGKQALTMCMGFGCNAAGVVGCRIIASPREKLIAILTNSFVPCNGRFPALITIITVFFVGAESAGGNILSTLILTGVVVLGIGTTFVTSYFLSQTVLKGEGSSLTLEMPPFRMPQIGKVVVRSVFDRTLFVLGRAVITAAPAGLVIWLTANISVGGETVLTHITGFLDPFAQVFGLDGVILTAFILGIPANEIVLPIILMAYTASGTLSETPELLSLYEILSSNGWTANTAACTIIFSLMHWPCATTLMTIKKETGSAKWTILAAAIPTVCGLGICFILSTLAKAFGG